MIITLIDDEETDHFIFKEIVKYLPNVEAITFDSPLPVLKLLQHGTFSSDIVLLDINMPIMNAWQFLDTLLEYKYGSSVFILSRSCHDRDVELSKKYSFVKGYLKKPLFPETLEKILATETAI
jgi:two-component SAPR family response regulator